MKKVTVFIVLFIFQFSLVAQSSFVGIVHYGHKQSFGMGAPIGVDYNATLIFDKLGSSYTFAKDSLEGGHINKMNMIEKNEEHIFMVYKKTTQDGFIYNIDIGLDSIRSRDIGYNYVNDVIPKIDWKLSSETKQIGKFTCSKATSDFRGRSYIAWFAPEIPMPYGPWKLQGLPGLILEAYDTNKEIYFYFKSIEYPSKKNLKIIIPNPITNSDMERDNPTVKREWISFKDYKKNLIERHEKATKMGRVLMGQIPTIKSEKSKNPMRNFYLEIFDEK